MAVAYERNDENTPETAVIKLRAVVEYAIAKGEFNAWCGICVSPSSAWVYEDAQTIFTSMEDARPAMEQAELENHTARLIFGVKAKN